VPRVREVEVAILGSVVSVRVCGGIAMARVKDQARMLGVGKGSNVNEDWDGLVYVWSRDTWNFSHSAVSYTHRDMNTR
jgi:hypothetical protein